MATPSVGALVRFVRSSETLAAAVGADGQEVTHRAIGVQIDRYC